MIGIEALRVVGKGAAAASDSHAFDARTRAVIRYADVAAWTTAAAIAGAVSDSREKKILSATEQVGVVAISDQGPAATMAQIDDAARAGFSSPMRYAACNPGSLAGVACIALGFRGPTLNLTMPPEEGVRVALQMSAGWLDRGAAQWVVVATLSGDTKAPSGRALLLSRQNAGEAKGSPFTLAAEQWLAGAGVSPVGVDE